MIRNLVKKVTVLALTASFFSAALIPAAETYAATNDLSQQRSIQTTVAPISERVVSVDPSAIMQGQSDHPVEPQIKRWLAKKAIEGISKALREGANNKWVKKAISEYFDEETAKVFKRNLNDIADVLDEALRLNELASAWIKGQIYNVIYAATKNHGIAESISDGVVALISVFL